MSGSHGLSFRLLSRIRSSSAMGEFPRDWHGLIWNELYGVTRAEWSVRRLNSPGRDAQPSTWRQSLPGEPLLGATGWLKLSSDDDHAATITPHQPSSAAGDGRRCTRGSGPRRYAALRVRHRCAGRTPRSRVPFRPLAARPRSPLTAPHTPGRTALTITALPHADPVDGMCLARNRTASGRHPPRSQVHRPRRGLRRPRRNRPASDMSSRLLACVRLYLSCLLNRAIVHLVPFDVREGLRILC